MKVSAIDHINIQTHRLPDTVAFFVDVLGLVAGPPPLGLDPKRITWMFDANGKALIHITKPGSVSGESGEIIGSDTGALHHVAFDCSGYAPMIARLDRLAVDYRCNDVASIALRQLFVTEPNGILLELNFRAERH